MSLEVPDLVREKLHQLERELRPLHDYEPGSIFGGLHNTEGLSDSEKKGAWAEGSVFNLLPQRRDEPSVWGTYFGPMTRFTLQDGTEVSAPDIEDIDAEIIEHWQRRSREAVHPVLRARYADVVWDLGEKVTGTRSDVEYARIAIDAYLGAISNNCCKDQIGAVLYAERALHISLALNDRRRIDQTKVVMFALADKSVAEPQSIGLWSFLFDKSLSPSEQGLGTDGGGAGANYRSAGGNTPTVL